MKSLGAVIVIAVACFFLLVANTTVQFHNTLTNMDAGRNRLRPIDLGFSPILSNNGVHENDFVVTAQEQNNGLIQLAAVYTNITSQAFMMAVYNNSLLNVKTHVWVLAMQSIIVNGISLTTGETVVFKQPLPPILSITNETLTYIINLRRVTSLDDIEDLDRPIAFNNSYSEFDLVRVAIAGIPAVLTSLATCIIVVSFLKEAKLQEGLPNEL